MTDCARVGGRCGCTSRDFCPIQNETDDQAMTEREQEHVGWIRLYVEGMHAENWLDTRGRIIRQLDEMRRDGERADAAKGETK